MKNIIMFGPPGSGKGTQAGRIAQLHGLKTISTGELLRREIQQRTPLGLQLETAIAARELVSDETATALLKKSLSGDHQGVIFDGYPRTLGQSATLTGLLSERNLAITHVFELRIADHLLIERVAGRFSCRGCQRGYHDIFAYPANGVCCGEGWDRRPEDNATALGVRLRRYHDNVQEVLKHWNQHPYFHVIDAGLPMSEVAQQIDGFL